MNQITRQRQLLQRLELVRQMSIADVMSALGVSRDTARRDIVALTDQGLAQRTHGGLQVLNFGSRIPSYADRLHQFDAVKTGLAELVLPLMKVNQYLFIDVSTILLKLTQLMTQKATVYTHSLDNAISLATNPAVDLHLLGGALNQENRFFSGSATLSELTPIYFDQVFLGAAVVNERGIFYVDAGDAAIKRQALAQTLCGVLVCEHRKFGQIGIAHFCGGQLDQIQVLITDEPLTTEEQSWFMPGTVMINLMEEKTHDNN